jgi:hypothetical protein
MEYALGVFLFVVLIGSGLAWLSFSRRAITLASATPAPAGTPAATVSVAKFRWLNTIWILGGIAILFVIVLAIWRSGSASLNWLDWRVVVTMFVLSFLLATLLQRMAQAAESDKDARKGLELASWSAKAIGTLAVTVWALSFLWFPTQAVAAQQGPTWGVAEARASEPVEEDPNVTTVIIIARWGSWSSWYTLPPRCNFEVVPRGRVLYQTESGKQRELGPGAVGPNRESSGPQPVLIHNKPLGKKDATRSFTSLVPGKDVEVEIRLRRQ